jgi:CRISPR-associated endonuclease/helicase Cas3
MTSSDFARFYSAIHGYAPFPWQSRLAAEVLSSNDWPDISVPTSSGKTSVIDTAVFALAAQADLPRDERKAPLRIFFVVDRRLVVDDAFEHAKELAERLENPTASDAEIVIEVRRRLLRLQGLEPTSSAPPLLVSRLRGGMYASESWVDAPNQPLICVSTVDQIGSRLLFRGYGVSAGRRPVDAALVGTDSLIILDEAHISRPFLETLRQVQAFQEPRWSGEPMHRPLRVSFMSATLPEGREMRRIELAEEDLNNPVLARRLQASKIAELKETIDSARSATEEATRLQARSAQVIGVVLNTVGAARKAFDLLRAAEKPAILLTGRIRPYDRDQLLIKHLEKMRVGRKRGTDEPFFVVATQTIEVGANLDFDAMVTEIAPLDALRQRFGRLNRMGELESAKSVILRPKASEVERIYKEPLKATWQWLEEHASIKGKQKTVDFGVQALNKLIGGIETSHLNTAAEEGPVLFPAHLDAWAQTNPTLEPDPDVTPFLHGKEGSKSTDVQIVWRKDLGDAVVEDWIEIISLAPPLPAEALGLPIGTAKRWLGKEIGAVTDLEGVTPPEDEDASKSRREFLIWRGPEQSRRGEVGYLRPGDTIIVQINEGGMDEFGWNPNSGPVTDVGDECANERARLGKGRYRVRRRASEILAGDVEERQLHQQFRSWLREAIPLGGPWEVKKYGAENDSWLIGISRSVKALNGGRKAVSDVPPEEFNEDDNSALNALGYVTLTVHTNAVVARARQYAQLSGLSADHLNAIVLAARFHDLGKSDPRFQAILNWSGEGGEELLAKGPRPPSARAYLHRRELSGYPSGARHEFGSMLLAEKHAMWPSKDIKELALYLIGTHHGQGRALAPVWREEEDIAIPGPIDGQSVTAMDVNKVARLGSGWVDRYWSVTRKYGWWGIAHLEALLRRADSTVSRDEEQA